MRRFVRNLLDPLGICHPKILHQSHNRSQGQSGPRLDQEPPLLGHPEGDE